MPTIAGLRNLRSGAGREEQLGAGISNALLILLQFLENQERGQLQTESIRLQNQLALQQLQGTREAGAERRTARGQSEIIEDEARTQSELQERARSIINADVGDIQEDTAAANLSTLRPGSPQATAEATKIGQLIAAREEALRRRFEESQAQGLPEFQGIDSAAAARSVMELSTSDLLSTGRTSQLLSDVALGTVMNDPEFARQVREQGIVPFEAVERHPVANVLRARGQVDESGNIVLDEQMVAELQDPDAVIRIVSSTEQLPLDQVKEQVRQSIAGLNIPEERINEALERADTDLEVERRLREFRRATVGQQITAETIPQQAIPFLGSALGVEDETVFEPQQLEPRDVGGLLSSIFLETVGLPTTVPQDQQVRQQLQRFQPRSPEQFRQATSPPPETGIETAGGRQPLSPADQRNIATQSPGPFPNPSLGLGGQRRLEEENAALKIQNADLMEVLIQQILQQQQAQQSLLPGAPPAPVSPNIEQFLQGRGQ